MQNQGNVWKKKAGKTQEKNEITWNNTINQTNKIKKTVEAQSTYCPSSFFYMYNFHFLTCILYVSFSIIIFHLSLSSHSFSLHFSPCSCAWTSLSPYMLDNQSENHPKYETIQGTCLQFAVCLSFGLSKFHGRWKLKDGRGKMKNERWNIRNNGRWKREHAGLKMEHESGTNEARRMKDDGWRMKDEGCRMQGWFDFWVLYRSNIRNIWTITYFWFTVSFWSVIADD